MKLSPLAITQIAGIIFASLCIPAVHAAENTAQHEQDLIAVLKSDAPASEKAITCKRLAVYGSREAVPVLAPLLADERLASWARIPLEAIPGNEADEAFRDAAQQLSGRLLIGTINSIGVRRDAAAVDILEKHLDTDDEPLASAAAVALGRIGTESAAKVLESALAEGSEVVRAAAADGCVLCAENFLADGKTAEATALYDQVRQADVPKQRMLEATRGAILARGADGIPLLLEQLRSPNRDLYAIGLFTAREVGTEATDALVAHLLEVAPQRRADLLLVLADRGDRAVLPAVLQSAWDGPNDARSASIRVLERLGDVSCVQTLLDVAVESEPELSNLAKTALEKLPDPNVDSDLVDRLSAAQGKTRQAVIEVIGKRRVDAYPDLRKAADDADGEIRRAALLALGSTVELDNLSFLIERVVSPKHAADNEAAATALRAASVRMHERELCATQLSDALPNASASAKQTILKILGEMGGTKALQTLGATARTAAPELQDTATRLLGQWMTVDASSELIQLAKVPGPYQIRALRGYIRLARQFLMSPEQRTDMCRTALEVATRDAERMLVLNVLERYPSIEMLKLAVQLAKIPAIKSDAAKTGRAIAKKIGNESAEVKALLSQLPAE